MTIKDQIEKLSYELALERCDATVPEEIVIELAKKIAKEELTDWDVCDDEHELYEEVWGC